MQHQAENLDENGQPVESADRHHDTPKDTCFVCKGFGHWARECTSLPSAYLKDNAPRCYNCAGLGHYARFCPNVLFGKQGAVFFDDGAWYPPLWLSLPSQTTSEFYTYEPTSEVLPADQIPRSESDIQADTSSPFQIVLAKTVTNGNTAH